MRQIRREVAADRHVPAHRGGADVRGPGRVAQQRAVHRPAVLAEPARTRSPAHQRLGGDRRRVRGPSARCYQRRPDQAADHRVRARCAWPAGSAHPQLPARAVTPGTRMHGGVICGDPASAGLTRLARELGWPGPARPGRFDILPLIVQAPGARPTWHELPSDAVLEVPLHHPDFSWFAELGLRWYAVPVISDMHLEAGGICYPAAPFNGWYMCTEIGSRDLGDAGRYNELPTDRRAHGPAHRLRPHPVEGQGAHRAEPRGPALVQLRRRDDHRPPHRVGPVPQAPARSRSARAVPARPTGRGSSRRPPRPRRRCSTATTRTSISRPNFYRRCATPRGSRRRRRPDRRTPGHQDPRRARRA